MRLTIDTKEDSVHEIRHVINLLQQALARGSQQPPSHAPSLYSDPPRPAPAPPPSPPPSDGSVMSMFNTPPRSQSSPPVPDSPTYGHPSSTSNATPKPAAQEHTPNIFDIFGNANDTEPVQQAPLTTSETAEDLLRYDKEHDDNGGDRRTGYTFTTY